MRPDDMKKFEEITRNFDLSSSAKRDAAKVRSLPSKKPVSYHRPARRGPWQKLLAWAENRALTQERSWARH